ncbi:LamG domain-containing protein [Marinilongibacter aquaticus]|uniref:LamG domain-containing protein n=1 Tax=Marinilongibacter aquaticus TaxID=2975157 RepID=UPI0021BD7EB4|nr:LamG domain-containing protein [Marinilongibacter aquaticus]UBM58145.1 LamG domain-containing protein [Marinilongibacter aquaticus]
MTKGIEKLVFLLLILVCSMQALAQNTDTKQKTLMKSIRSTEGFVALWKFDEPGGKARKAKGKHHFKLKEGNGFVSRVNEGPLSGYSILLEGDNYLSLPNTKTQSLNIHGPGKEVTVIAYVKWTGEQTGFVGGMWNEYADGGKRQYGLFVSLPYYNGRDQVCGHISKNGRATAPFPYSIDYSASPQKVPTDTWTYVAFSYDGEYIKSYLNGNFETRDPELIEHTMGFEGFPDGLTQSKNPYYFPDGMGNNGSDFTVGAVLLKRGMGNFFKGQIGGLAVFDKALSDEEIARLAL